MAQPGQGLNEANRPLEDVDPAEHPPLGTKQIMVPTSMGPYMLAPSAAHDLKLAAKQDCRICKGTGIGQWRRRGFRAVPCKCAYENWLYLTGQTKIVPAGLAHLIEQPKESMLVVGPGGTIAK